MRPEGGLHCVNLRRLYEQAAADLEGHSYCRYHRQCNAIDEGGVVKTWANKKREPAPQEEEGTSRNRG
jgi:hypothetical protein